MAWIPSGCQKRSIIHSSCKPLLDSRLLLSAPADRPSVSRYLVQSAYQRENARESARGPEQWSSWQQQLVLKWCIFTCLPQTERASAPWVHELPGREAQATARGHDLQRTAGVLRRRTTPVVAMAAVPSEARTIGAQQSHVQNHDPLIDPSTL